MNTHLVNREYEGRNMEPMFNDKREIIDKYIPRKCAATSKLIGPKEHSAIQISIPDVDENGRVIQGSSLFSFAMGGFVREKGRTDLEITKLLKSKGLYPLTN